MEEKIKKWSGLIEAAKRYWIDSLPTGISDSEFDRLEKEALSDGFSVRDYIFQTYLTGTKTKNQWIEKIKKFKVESGKMLDAIKKSADELGIPYDQLWVDLKYDGSSLAIYIDPLTGKPLRIVTVGNMNLDNFGVDQTAKLIHHIPSTFPKGIKAIQCEALIDINRLSGNPDAARQKANGLINSKYCEAEVASLLTIRAYRYYVDENIPEGLSILSKDYKTVLESLRVVKSPLDGHILFAPADTWTLQELINSNPDWLEKDQIKTSTGVFLADGLVLYNNSGQCQRAMKFSGAGSGTEAIKTIVREIQWNDQGPKGKDSWSANVLIDPIVIKGCTIKKPSAGSVNKLVKNKITPGAEVGIIMANSTIPMVGEVFKQGDGNYQFPTCACGYKMSENDIYGSLLKCGNKNCSERLERQIKSLGNPKELLDLNTLLVIDRFKWENAQVDKSILLGYVEKGEKDKFEEYLESFLKTDLQKRNLKLVVGTAWKALRIVMGYDNRK